MSFAADIDPDEYLYRQVVSITETSGSHSTNLAAKLELTSSNFNFALARSDGKDFRLAYRSNGQQVLNMFIAAWSTTSETATIWFGVPELAANETKQLFAFWGSPADVGISDGTKVNLILADSFDTFNSSIWTQSAAGCYTITNSEIYINYAQYLTTTASVLSGKKRWTIEAKFRTTAVGSAWTYRRYCGYYTVGGYNAPGIAFYYAENQAGGSQYHRNHNFDTCASHYDPGVWGTSSYDKGLTYNAPHFIRITYEEDKDLVTLFMDKTPRGSWLGTYTDLFYRSCLGNTRPNQFRLYGQEVIGGLEVWNDYIIIADLDNQNISFDTSNLFVEFENIPAATLSTLTYGPDETDISYYHESSSGGDALSLSDNDLLDVFTTTISDEIIIDFSRKHGDLTSVSNIHYDNGHVTNFAAVKLSDKDLDRYGDTYFNSTTTSGYVAVTYSGVVNTLSVVAISGEESSMIKDFYFAGTNSDPRFNSYIDRTLLVSGTFNEISNWQTVYFENSTAFNYYSLHFNSTYGDVAKLQEWRLNEGTTGSGTRTIARLRLRPGTLTDDYKYFPKKISFYGNNDLDNWEELIPETYTYTPNRTHWQEYAFTNTTAYRSYKLVCEDNWLGTTDKIIIAEWELNELL